MSPDRPIRDTLPTTEVARDVMVLLSGYDADQRRRGLAASTIARRRDDLGAFARWVAPRGLLEATAADIEAFLDGRPLGSRSLYRWLSTLSCFYGWCVRAGHATHNPAAEMARPRLRRGLPRPIADDDLTEALAQASGDMRAWLTLAAYAGLRVSEIAALEGPDVCWGDRLLRASGKGGRERLVPMHPRVTTELGRRGVPTYGAVFRRPDGSPWSAAQVSRRISEFLSACGIAATAHQLRHWFGSRTYAASQDLRVVQELLGHASPTTTAIYTAWSHAEAVAAVNGL